MGARIKQKNNNKNSLAFIKEVAKYFMDFLETDFHKRRNPKRSIKFRNEDNLLIGLNLNKYSAFNNLVRKSINHAFDRNILSKIEKGVYRTNIPKNLLDLIRVQVDKLSVKKINLIVKNISKELEKIAVLHKKEYDRAVTSSLENISKIIKEGLVLPFIRDIEKPLENLNLGDENTIYLMEEELTAVLVNLLGNKVFEVLKLLIAKEKVEISKELESVFNINDVKNNIVDFFEIFKVTDLFTEIFEIDRNKNILDKQEFYLYFCDITFNKAKYPIFYIPFSVEKQNDIFNIDFDAQVYINKRALEYVVQEYNNEKGKKGSLKKISERIIYLAQHRNDFREVVNDVLNEIVNFFELDSSIDTDNPNHQTAKSFFVRISNSCYVSLFDKSDEALVNDYEEILQLLESEDSVLADAFNKLIEDFVYKEPIKFNLEVKEEWGKRDIPDKLVFRSPIPLNEEQLQIVSALKKEGCKYVIVEGPPGTGKSHTITAILFNAVLKNQSVLMLSDKKEALDVVEDKLTQTINTVRREDNFQNPILRLGKTGNAYAKILARNSIDKITQNYLAVRQNYEKLRDNIERSENTLKEDLEAEILAYNEIDIKEIYELFNLESYYEKHDYSIDIREVLKQPQAAIELEEFRKIFISFKKKLCEDKEGNKFLRMLGFSINDFKDLSGFQKFLDLLVILSDDAQKLRNVFKEKIKLTTFFKKFSDEDLETLDNFIKEYENLKTWIFGYFLKGNKVDELNRKFRRRFPSSKFTQPHQSLDQLRDVLEIFNSASDLKKQLSSESTPKLDYLNVIHQLLKDKGVLKSFQKMVELERDIEYLNNNFDKYPKTLKKIKLKQSSFGTFYDNELIKMNSLKFNKLVRYITIRQKIEKDFKNLPEINYASQKKNIEDLITAQMTYLLDERVVKFYEHSSATATALRSIIRSKQRFPRDEFSKLKEAFPCILAGIRDYAEYIPLEPEIFDLVVIDEASQVSIAQAFPALLRAKKVLILGDKKQFSNVKSYQARTDSNREYLNDLKDSFKKNVSEEEIKIVKLAKFNIKTSILEFFEFISNYNTQLLKYFRGYKEIISYSNKYFYQDGLQVMKIRGKPINEVLKFKFIEHDGKQELIQNTNIPEIEFIISELQKLKDQDSNLSVGIITPHTNQQKLAMEMISKLQERDYFFDKLKLKIMTFDTCQGEERDIIFYSMVATEDSDRLWGVFIKDLGKVDIEEDGRIKAQRLNVGFSRSRECMYFVLSKSLDKYTGSIGEALRHYHYTLEETKKEKSIDEVDQKSKMEPKVMHWFYQTKFWIENKKNIELRPQFKIGKYLRQLDRTYNHPDYIVDFLLVYKDEGHKEHKIIIEYDGFQEHFKDIDEIGEFNYQYYYSDEDVYRQRVLESYGYKFLRINKFNIGESPVVTLDERISKLLKKGVRNNRLLDNIHGTIEALQSGEMKECPKCKKVRELKDFYDPSLLTGYGRFCLSCKNKSKEKHINLINLSVEGQHRLENKVIKEFKTTEWKIFVNNVENWEKLRRGNLLGLEEKNYLASVIMKLNTDFSLTERDEEKLKILIEEIVDVMEKTQDTEQRICSKCGSGMVLRKGRYGEFYGCSRFPYCRGTRPY